MTVLGTLACNMTVLGTLSCNMTVLGTLSCNMTVLGTFTLCTHDNILWSGWSKIYHNSLYIKSNLSCEYSAIMIIYVL